MKRITQRALILLAAITLVAANRASATERSEVPDRYKWDLTSLYPTQEAWAAAKQDITQRITGMARFQGHLGASADSLYMGIKYLMDLNRDLARLYVYASQLSDQDVRVSKNLEMEQSTEQLGVQLNTATSFVTPELIAVGPDRLHKFVASDSRLKEYAQYLDNILRYVPHTLTPAEEKVAAQAGMMANAGTTIHGVFADGELPYPTVTMSNGEKVRIDQAAYTLHRASPNKADRDTVFHAFWGRLQEFKGTLAAALDAHVRSHLFARDVHNYKSCVEEALFENNIPTSVYTQLIADAHQNLPTLHRYLRLRQRMMGLSSLGYEDLYAPIVKEVNLKYTPEQAMALVLEAVAPLGPDYVATLRKGYASRWIDWIPTTGKRSGAYSNGAYGVHPYQLQNFTGLYEEVSTLAHESGHSIHTYLADEHQPFATHDYATFVAEVASTLNEDLLLHSMLGKTQDKATRLFLLGSHLESLRTTLFRQTMFGEFELKIHEMVENGETLTGDNLSKLYLDLLREYYGHDQGVCRVDSLYAIEWAYIHHFFDFNFYVYQYATSIVASTAIANGILDEAALPKPEHARCDAYLNMLSSGSSKYPIDLLKGAGVDMTTPAPFQAAMREMNSTMDEMEKLLK